MEETTAGPAPAPVAAAVIDTNVWLDLFFFRDAAVQPLAQALHSGRVQAVRSARTDAELPAVLARPLFAARCTPARAQALIDSWLALARNVEELRRAPWICRDPQDQKFLDLAFSAPAALLYTKDRALLGLARRARRDGLSITQPRSAALPAIVPGAGRNAQ